MKELLKRRVLEKSVSQDLVTAINEWSFNFVFQRDNSRCLCNHPIKNVCVIKNLKNGTTTEVGNCCVKNFMGIKEGDEILASILRLKKDNSKNIGGRALDFIRKRNIVLEKNDFDFYTKVSKKRCTYKHELEKKKEINDRFIRYFSSENATLIKKFNKIEDWIKTGSNSKFDPGFFSSVKSTFDVFGSISAKQEQSLDNIISKWILKQAS